MRAQFTVATTTNKQTVKLQRRCRNVTNSTARMKETLVVFSKAMRTLPLTRSLSFQGNEKPVLKLKVAGDSEKINSHPLIFLPRH